MSLNVAWPRPDGTLSCSTVDVQGQSSIRVLTDQIKQSLGSEPGSLVAVMQPAELKRLAIVPLKPPMPLSELCSSWEAAQADYETWAKDLAAELDEIVSLDDYDNLLDVHILALLLPLASISFQANTRHEDFQADTLGSLSGFQDLDCWPPVSPARSPKLLFPTDQLPQKVSPIGPTTSAFSPTCTTCHQRGHYTGACCGTLPSLQHVPACRSREAGQSKRRPIYDPLDEPEAHQDIRRKFGKSPDSMTISFSSHQRLHKRQRLDIEEEHFSDFLQPTPSLSPTATTISADNSTSSSTAIPGPSRYLSLSNMDSSGGVSATFPQRCPNQAKTPRRKTKVAKFAEAEQRKKARKERLKHWDPQRLLELRRELRLEFPKHLETDGRDGTIGLYDGVLCWAQTDSHPWWPAEVLCFEERGVVPRDWRIVDVLFFEADGRRTTAKVQRKTLLQLGVNDEFDELMITSQKFFANKRKKAHTLRRVKEDLNEAYERAKLVEEDDSDDTDVSQ